MKPEDVKPEDVKPEDVKPEDVKPEVVYEYYEGEHPAWALFAGHVGKIIMAALRVGDPQDPDYSPEKKCEWIAKAKELQNLKDEGLS